MDSLSESRLQLVHPQLAAKVRTMAQMLALEGIEIRVTQGLRSWSDQAALWMKGRDADDNVIDKSKVVTNAPPGHSYHNFGLAVDVAPFIADGSVENAVLPATKWPDWNLSHPCWKRIVAVGESLGLASGSEFRTFPDWPHLQLTGALPISPNDEVRQTFKDGGTFAVWKETQLEAAV